MATRTALFRTATAANIAMAACDFHGGRTVLVRPDAVAARHYNRAHAKEFDRYDPPEN